MSKTIRPLIETAPDGTFRYAAPAPAAWHDAVLQFRAPMYDESVAMFGADVERERARALVLHLFGLDSRRRGWTFKPARVQWSEQRDTEHMTTYLVGTLVP